MHHTTANSKYGQRTFPQTLDELAAATPQRLYASVPRGKDLADGFIDVSCSEMSRSVDFMAHWIQAKLGTSSKFETLAYMGIHDLRSAVVFLAAVKCGFKILFPSPRNTAETNASLMKQTQCTTVLHSSELAPVVKGLDSTMSSLRSLEIPTFRDMLDGTLEPYPFRKQFEACEDDPILVLHSSGSTGHPKPITMTHGSFGVVDALRILPTVPGRKNRDYSIWNMKGGGKFYSVFPYFHLAGFLTLLVNPIFTDASSPVLGPPDTPPSGTLLKEIMQLQKLRALFLPPSIPEQLLSEPGGIEFFKGLDFLCYTGGPFSPSAREKLSQVTELISLYGTTEGFQQPQLALGREDWGWMEWNPNVKLEMQPSEDEVDTFELVLFADETTRKTSGLNHNLPGVREYRTKDLFKQHPQKPGLWQFYGRRDDILVLSNSEKFNPVPFELHVSEHPSLAGALVVGYGRPKPSLLVEPNSKLSADQEPAFIKAIWPLVESGNLLVPKQGRILRDKILIASSAKPFIRTGKGTIVRKLTEKLYDSEVSALYARGNKQAFGKARL